MSRLVSALSVIVCACAVPPSSPSPQSSQQELSGALCPPNVPAALTPAADQALFKIFPAEGVQIYRCTLTASGAYAWVFESPDALLLANDDWDDEGERRIIGHHYAGPTWEYKDHSTVVGARAAGATVDPTAIPWLLLNATGHGGSGLMSGVTSIQRLSTTGGLAPASGCEATTVGAIARVPYTAVYYFYQQHGGDNSGRQCP